MAIEIPTTEPASFVQGTTVKWTKQLDDYPPSAWTLTYYFASPNDDQSVVATDNGDGSHAVEITPAMSGAFADVSFEDPGYYWQAMAEHSDGRKYLADKGWMQVHPDMGQTQGGFDARSRLQQLLAALEATMAGKATKDQQSMTIEGLSIARLSWTELVEAHNRIKWKIASAQAEVDLADGLEHGGIIKARFD